MPIVGPAPAAGAAPDWPLIEYAVCWSAGPNDTPVQDYWCNLTSRTRGKTTVRRGKQYELDQVQPGEMTLTFENLDGAFDPTNTTSPFYPKVKPYRLVRLRAQYPATVNLLTADQATAFYASKGSYTGSSLPQWVHPGAGSTVTIVPYVTGSNLYAAGAAGQSVVFTGFAVQPGLTYTASCVAGVNTPTYTLTWYDVNGAVISSVSTHSVTVQNVTGTAPANAVGASVTVSDSAVAVTVGKVQVEQNSTASTWVQPGTWYSLFTGYVERWPQSWSSAGNYGTVAVDCVDLFGFLANAPLRDPFAADLLALGPNFLYELNEQSGTTVFQDLTGNRGPAIVAPTALANTLVAGQSLTSGDNAPPGQANPSLPLTGAFLGGQGPVVHSAEPTTGLQPGVGALLIPPNPATGLIGPAGSTWTRLIAARTTGAQLGVDSVAWYYYPAEAPTGDGLVIQVPQTTQRVMAAMTDNNGGHVVSGNYPIPAIANPSNAAMIDTDWHLFGIGYDGSNLLLYCDDHAVTAISGASAPTPTSEALGGWDCLAAAIADGLTDFNWNGDLAFVCEIPAVLTTAQWLALNASWRNAWASGSNNGAAETSGDRYARILGWIGYSGPSAVDTGAETAYGPATDITGGSNPTYALQALQNVVTTEYGQHYIAADGTVVFKARTARYNPAPAVSFGEQAGEVPYLNAAMDFDPTRVGNTVEVDAQYGNAAYFASDTDSINDYGSVGIQQTVNSLDPESLQDGAEYLLYQNKQPLQRLAALPVDVGANPSAFASLLGLDLGTAVTVNRRPSAAPVISQVGYVEQVQWTIGDDRSCQWSGQVSNALAHYFGALDSTAYGRLGADGNTLNAAITSTATSLAVATAAGKAVFSNSSSDYPMNILVDAEQITLTAAPGGSTSPQMFTVTRGANGTTPAAHSSGAAVSVVGSLVLGF